MKRTLCEAVVLLYSDDIKPILCEIESRLYESSYFQKKSTFNFFFKVG